MYYFYGCGSTRILEKLYVKRSKNQKLIQGGEKDITDMPKNRAFDVKIPATGRPSPERSGDRSSILATGRPKSFFYL